VRTFQTFTRIRVVQLICYFIDVTLQVQSLFTYSLFSVCLVAWFGE